MKQGDLPAVLVVDDDPNVVELYAQYLGADYHVRTAETGEEALETVDETIDVIVLDRRLPDVSGDEVLERVRERELDCRVAMVTAVDPDYDIIEMPFDDYLAKPVGRRRLRKTVSHLLRRIRYSATLEEYYRVASTIAALEASKPRRELREHEKFVQLQDRARELRDEVTEKLLELDDYVGAFYEAERAYAIEDA